MKISGPGSIRSSEVRRAKKGGDGKGSSFSVSDTSETSETSESAPIRGAGGVSAVGALLSVQEVTDALDSRSKGLQRGVDILNILDNLRHGLLMGRVPEGQLRTLVARLEQRRGEFPDPNLEAVIQEIELRAAVELAKFERMRK